jgi:hypothetical protein
MKQKIIEAVLMLIAALIASIPLKFIFKDSYGNVLIYTLVIFMIMYLVGMIVIPFLARTIFKHKNKQN